MPATQQTFTASGGASAGAAAIASAPFTPPNAPQAFTTFLLGSKSFGYSLLPQVDAPETGPCKPSEEARSAKDLAHDYDDKPNTGE